MKKVFLSLLVFFFVFSNARAAEDLPPLPKGPLILTTATPAMQAAEYWIKRVPDAEKPVKTLDQLKHFNEEIRSTIPECVDVFRLETVRQGKHISSQLQLEYDTLKNRKLFDQNGKTVPKSVFEETIKPVMQVGKVPSKIKMRWGAAVRATSVRALPTPIKMIEGADDIEFDQLQFTQIKLWTPVGIFHESSDGKWLYVQAPYVRGWVRAKDIAVFPDRDRLKLFTRSGRFLVVTGESARVYADAGLQKMIQRPSMGTALPLVSKKEAAAKKDQNQKSLSESADVFTVWMPYRKEDGSAAVSRGYVRKKNDVSQGFPVYSRANVIRQAFKLLGVRYGWGGMYNGRDCSGFVHDVFLSLGVDLPRDSKQQALIGTQLGYFKPFQDDSEKAAVLRSARGGLTLIKMPHHQMLFLGTVNDQFYVIHSTWAERTGQDQQLDEKRRINQVVVSDLNLNGKSYIGSLFDRIVSINEVD